MGTRGGPDIAGLRRRIAGAVVTSDDAAYAATRRAMLWNRLVPARAPEAIVQVASEDDVIAAVRFARDAARRVAVRSGGHSWCGAPLRDDGLLLDLGRLDGLDVDAARRVARVGPAVRGGDLVRRLATTGLAFPVGHCASVAMGGYLLAGGLGWNPGVWGPACRSVDAVDVVTADGRSLTATADTHADLLWAARGAGPAFPGVVTRFHLTLHPLPRAITTSTWTYPLERAGQVVAGLATVAPSLPPELEVVAILAAAGGTCTVVATAFADDARRAGAMLTRLERHGADGYRQHEAHQPTPLDALLTNITAAFPERHRYLAEAMWTDAPPDEVLGVLGPRIAAAPTPGSHAIYALPTGPPPAPMDGAFAAQGRSLVLAYAVWDDRRSDARCRAWHRGLVAALDPFTTGHYLGESDVAAHPARAARAFPPASWHRISALRQTWDPSGVFQGWFG
jgi:FAD/FMN-containing dehydrogenase